MATKRGTSNSNSRGSSAARRVRKQWVLDTFGDGTTAVCSFDDCETELTFETMTIDRYPISGIDGGTYKRDNIRPACGKCNSADGAAIGAARKKARLES